MSYTTETITAFANLLAAVKGLQPDNSEAIRMAGTLITQQAAAKNKAIASIEAMKYDSYLRAQEKGNAYAMEMLSQVEPDAKTDERYFKELDGGGYFKGGGQLPLDHRKARKDAVDYFETMQANQINDEKNAKLHLLYTGMDKNSKAAEEVYLRAQSDLEGMINYRNDLLEKSEKMQNVSDGQDNLGDMIPFFGARKEVELTELMESTIDKQQSLVDYLARK